MANFVNPKWTSILQFQSNNIFSLQWMGSSVLSCFPYLTKQRGGTSPKHKFYELVNWLVAQLKVGVIMEAVE